MATTDAFAAACARIAPGAPLAHALHQNRQHRAVRRYQTTVAKFNTSAVTQICIADGQMRVTLTPDKKTTINAGALRGLGDGLAIAVARHKR